MRREKEKNVFNKQKLLSDFVVVVVHYYSTNEAEENTTIFFCVFVVFCLFCNIRVCTHFEGFPLMPISIIDSKQMF